MINLVELIQHQKNFLTEKECDFLISEYENNPARAGKESCPHAFTGVNTTSSFSLYKLNYGTEAFNIIHNATERMVQSYHNYLDKFNAFHILRKKSMLFPHIYRLMKYEKGASIHPHTDHDPGVYGSCTFNLNEDYTGGMFAFWGGKHKVKLGKGDGMIWPADYFWVHEVETITSGVRYSTNCFLTKNIPSWAPNLKEYNIK
jgi:hypothetical protein